MEKEETAAKPLLTELYISRMQNEHLPQVAIDLFCHYFELLCCGTAATIAESSIKPLEPDSVRDAAETSTHADAGLQALKNTAILKLNGGLGSTMGLTGPKSLIKAKNGLSFLEISLEQIKHLNQAHDTRVPLILMNSFFTDQETRAALNNLPGLPNGLVEIFLQHKFPKILVDTLEPALFPQNPLLEWNPAGHGDLIISLETSGLLNMLIEKGFHYLFVSNIDNLGAQMDTGILGYFASQKLDFLMEVTERTPMDRKGGHLALQKSGRLALREFSQCSKEDYSFFSDIGRHRFFNTNNLWLNLESVRRIFDTGQYRNMPLILNRKQLNLLDQASPKVYQLESALGSAITLFENSSAIQVPRSRFAPVKNCEELLLVWSDYYTIAQDYRITANPARKSGKTVITLDPRYYSRIDQLESRFPHGAPSLVDCESLSITGDVRFGRNITVRDTVTISNTNGTQAVISDNTFLTGNVQF